MGALAVLGPTQVRPGEASPPTDPTLTMRGGEGRSWAWHVQLQVIGEIHHLHLVLLQNAAKERVVHNQKVCGIIHPLLL